MLSEATCALSIDKREGNGVHVEINLFFFFFFWGVGGRGAILCSIDIQKDHGSAKK